jgi:23S rRNA-/tRNA-specific pseudouridylate synthase
MERGIIRVNGERVNDDYVLDGSERIQLDGVIHLERPVPCPNMIEFIHEDENYLVVNKPSCIPVAPGEPFFKNSLIHILEDDYYKTDLKRKC